MGQWLAAVAPTAWGKPVDGVELSLTPFTSVEKVGYLGFQVYLRGMNEPSSPRL
jgi:hypothetical protein